MDRGFPVVEDEGKPPQGLSRPQRDEAQGVFQAEGKVDEAGASVKEAVSTEEALTVATTRSPSRRS